MKIISLAIQLLLAYTSFAWSTLTHVVEIRQGKLRGVRSAGGHNRYYSVPYATSERFQPPKTAPKWEGIFNAISPFIRCPQKVSFFMSGNEDCLYLDVYTPGISSSLSKFPVMVFLHGGAYFKGSKELYDPQFLVTKGVVVVIINYRLGVLGFLCLNGISNLGLRDQVAALKWVRRNIAAFGGDPDNVTLCGQSAGASSASMHLLTELSKGLFHKAILMSGTALSTWAFNIEPSTAAFDDASKISTPLTETDVFHTFAEADLDLILDATYDTSVNPRFFKYSPCVDVNFTQPFFRDAPFNILKSGKFNKVPLMIGYTDKEGGFFYRLLSEDTVNDLSDNFVDRLPCVFSWCSKEERRKISEMMRSHYFGEGYLDYRASVTGLINYFSDWIAYGSINAFSKVMAQFSDQPIFNYQFSYGGGRDFGKFLAGTDFNGTTHAGEVFYIFKPMGITLPLSKQDEEMIDRLTTLIKNFMTFGNPTPKRSKPLPLRWPPASNDSSNIFVINKKMSVIKRPRRGQRGEFFLEMLCSYGQSGYVPCESRAMCTHK
ncbi:juvenile hormone esterase [Bicyclus anynana]|uniref:Carboxylic ester hydrolase n=1 Tax=Bicyclus anynana TaxID=110368 RepID=A0A6J1N178_BICAN|nr:juvenile hormone esterase [Bicyclus anynana]XP_023941606.1 juvenile hormone esterase [Bicyclus anynana]XP_052743709.1 juvenile hormone esterase [Bicyclus anynana]